MATLFFSTDAVTFDYNARLRLQTAKGSFLLLVGARAKTTRFFATNAIFISLSDLRGMLSNWALVI